MRGLHLNKKILCFVFVILILSLFAGCGNPANNDNKNSSGIQQSEKKLEIKSASSFYGGVSVVINNNDKKYAIDTKSNILFEVTSEDNHIIFFGDTASVDDSWINKKGEVIVSPEKMVTPGYLPNIAKGMHWHIIVKMYILCQ